MKIGVACAALVALLFLVSPDFLGAEWWLFDRYSRQLAQSRPPDSRIVLVTVSEETVRILADFYGRPPYPRDVWAMAVDELKRAGAKVIAFDILFGEQNLGEPAGDRQLAAALEGAPAILAANPPLLPDPMFRRHAQLGAITLAREDAVVRTYRYAHSGLPSLAVAAANRFGASHVLPAGDEMLIRWNAKKPEEGKNEKETGKRTLQYAEVRLDKLVQASLLRTEGSLDPATAEAFARQFRGRIVLIGYTAAGLLDLRANPLSSIAPGLEIHANAVDNLINADFTQAANRWLMFPLILLIGGAFGAGLDRTRYQLLAGIATALVIAAILLAGYGALAAGYMVPAFAATVAVALTYVVLTVVNFVAEQQQTAQLRATFGRYVSPQILEHILAHPEKVQLGGERRDLTILFSDIRGFTSISEAAEPEQVVEMLNEYLTRMVDILLAHGGTLDKFIGDAVMGFWNAPADDPDHARHAAACAVEMIEETARIRARWEQEGKASIRIGIGLNTGEAIAGNIGSERVFGYTVIGDAVNLASRLEGKNKDYGTEIIVSESTLARMGDGFETVYLDEVKVKGKERAVKIYEVKGTR